MASCSGVLLGVLDELMSTDEDASNDWTTNKIGGVPKWMNGMPELYPQCSLCGTSLPLITQIYCPLENSSYHRVLYLFGCINTLCWNKKESWKVMRCQSVAVDSSSKVKFPVYQVQQQDSWCDEADIWGEEMWRVDKPYAMEDLVKQTKEIEINKMESNHVNGVSLQTINFQTKKEVPDLLYFTSYYLRVVEESHLISESLKLTSSEKRLLDEYKAKEGLSEFGMLSEKSKEREWKGEQYELGLAKHGDKTFQKFQKQIELFPNQCIRYSWNGHPLLMRSESLEAVPSCYSCGGKRVFELQLMPALVSFLKIAKNITSPKDCTSEKIQQPGHVLNEQCFIYQQNLQCKHLNSESIEFGTVFVFTCAQECWSTDAQYKEEFLIVHADPDQHLFTS